MHRYIALVNGSLLVGLHAASASSAAWLINGYIKYPMALTPSVVIHDPSDITMGELNSMLEKMATYPIVSYDEYCTIINETKTLINGLVYHMDRINEYEMAASVALENVAREREAYDGVLSTFRSMCDLLGANADTVSVGVLTRCKAK